MHSVKLLLGGSYSVHYLVGKVHTGSMVDQFSDNPHISSRSCSHKSRHLRYLKSNSFSNCNQQALTGTMPSALETFKVINYK